MAHIVDEGIGMLQAAGHKVQDGVSAVQKQAQKQTQKQTQKRKKSAWPARAAGLAASVAGAVTAFLVSSRLVRSRLGRRGQ
ncbi:hypothetical protein ABH926_010155 [Catenulispora sp. GP43]|uniref:hypothetical protein n=1 Tax=Catenulispora sp. GP43 TaxID=3156263 RepID=UPI0035195AC0